MKKQDEMKEILHMIASDPSLSKLFIRLWEDSDLLKILTTHTQLLSITGNGHGDVYPPFFLFRSTTYDDISGLKEAQDTAAAQILTLSNKIQEDFVINMNKKAQKKVINQLQELQQTQSSLGQSFPNESLLPKEMSTSVNAMHSFQTLVTTPEFEELMKLILNLLSNHIIQFGINGVKIFQYKITEKGLTHAQNCMAVWDLNVNQYNTKINELYTLGAITPVLSIAWCNSHPRLLFTTTILAPDGEPKINCPECNNQIQIATYYSFSPKLLPILKNEDRVLTIFLLWKLGLATQKVEYSTYKSHSESDIYLKETKTLIECKTFMTDTRQTIIDKNIKDSITQIKKNVDGWKGKKPKQILLTVNYTRKQINPTIENLTEEDKKLIEKYYITITPIDELKPTIKHKLTKNS